MKDFDDRLDVDLSGALCRCPDKGLETDLADLAGLTIEGLSEKNEAIIKYLINRIRTAADQLNIGVDVDVSVDDEPDKLLENALAIHLQVDSALRAKKQPGIKDWL